MKKTALSGEVHIGRVSSSIPGQHGLIWIQFDEHRIAAKGERRRLVIRLTPDALGLALSNIPSPADAEIIEYQVKG